MTAMPALTRLADDEVIFRDSVYEFADKEVRPLAREMDEQARMSQALIEKMFALGVMSVEVPESYGGAGGTFFHSVLAVESLSRFDPLFGVLVDVQNTLVINAVLRWGTDEVKRKYLPKLASKTIGAYCLSEAGSGSDAFAMATRATEKGDGFLLTGRKLWITNANEADLFIVFANVNPDAGYRGITAFIVDRGSSASRLARKKTSSASARAAPASCCSRTASCRSRRCSARSARATKSPSRRSTKAASASARKCSASPRARSITRLRYVKERKQFGKAIGEFQGVQFQIARMATDVEATRLLVYNCARLRDNGLLFLTEAAMCKVYSSEVAERVASMAVNLFGGNGFVKEYPVEKLYRDAKIGQIYEGTTNMQLMTIAKDLLSLYLTAYVETGL